MRSAGTKAVALATTSGLVAVLVVALYFSSVLFQRRNEDAQHLTRNNNTDKTTTSAPQVLEEFVKPIKKWPPPVHQEDPYPEEKQLKDDHHSGHFRERLAQIWDPHPEYEFTGFGRTFHLQLRESKAPFVVPNLKVAHVWDNMTRLEETPVSSGGCYYSGKVLGDPASNVFVNLCHGMTGHIRTSNGSYLIQPAEEWVDYRTPIRHILRKLNSGPPPRSNNCHTPEGDHAQHDDETSQRRSKRSTSQEYYLELMIVADRKMAEYHGKDLNTYVLNLMATASHIFTDASIGNMMTVTVVGLVIAKEEDFTRRRGWLENKKRGYNLSSSSASEMLSNFCRWQNNTSLYHHDTALLITRENICSNPLHEKCETLGLAEVGRVCTKEFSCAIVKDNGLGTAFTIAHELGHVLNMPHDEDNRCEKYNVDKISHVMARVLDNNTSPWSWSECSRQILTEFLHTGSGSCLLNPPHEDILPGRQNYLLGEVYDSDKQCELVFGPGWVTCSFRKECRRMWCSSNASNHHECRTGHMPWADGTPCSYIGGGFHRHGPDGWCHKGDCVPPDKTLLTPIDGEWGSWREYGECSRTCGGGIKKSIRLCDSPSPVNGGRYCIGQRVRYLSCNTHDCPLGTMEFREQQCSAHNNRKFQGKGLTDDIKWVPKYGGVPQEDRCKLYCLIAESTAYYMLADKVIDGTPCGPENTYGICVDGACHRTGCDHVLNSKTELDMCGVCGGDNSTCLQKKGSYNNWLTGYTQVVRIPKGASNLDIRQYASNVHGNKTGDNNYIALVDSDSREYILNGDYIVEQFKKLILYEGTNLQYSGSGTGVERVNASLPLKKDLIIEVLSFGAKENPPNLFYEYVVQKHPHLYRWDLETDYNSCDKECFGVRWRDYRCIKVDDDQAVAEQMCDEIEKPARDIIKCNNHCELSWEIVSKSECSNPCGVGERTVSMKCVKTILATGEKHNMYEEACSHIQQPPRVEECAGMCDNTGWKYSLWGPCSVSCGDGKKKRTAKCVDSADRERDESECDPADKKLTGVCNLGECPTWEVELWTPCSVTCGRGYRTRPYYCRVGNRTVKSMCNERDAPISQEVCEERPCPYWKEVGESACSATCGSGVKILKFECSVPNACSNLTKPPHTKHCSIPPCSLQSENAIEDEKTFPARYTWRQKWSACSASCGHGRQTKTTQCFDTSTEQVVSAKYCLPLNGGTFEVNACYTRCAQWKYDDWEPCSAICGEGFETRKVFCEGENGQILPDHHCNHHLRPVHERKCKVDCHNHNNEAWEVGLWSACSVTCGEGVQYRPVTCRMGNCHYSDKPDRTQICSMGPCYTGRWEFGNWGECTVTCGQGIKELQVFCKAKGVIVPEKLCAGPKPAPKNSCYIEGSCEKSHTSFVWRAEKWSPCMLNNCTKTRRLYCANGDEQVEDSECEGLQRPKTTRPCKRMCPKGVRHPYVWRPDKWSQCSSSCGRGKRTRAVHCFWRGRNKRRQQVDDRYCAGSKPISEDYCEGSCGRKSQDVFTWEPGPWKMCSHYCSKKGKQERTVHCVNGVGKEVHKRLCNKSKKPPNRRKCEEKCPTCRDLYLMKKEEDLQDGEYSLYPRGPSKPAAKVYCYEMNSGRPKEYITVDNENYAMIYEEDIRGPSSATCSEPAYRQCPYTPSRLRSGFTRFNKLALNASTLTVIANDFTFADAVRGSHVPVGEAGDCFSKRCPQGAFKISLRSTSFVISRDSEWHVNKYSSTSIKINREDERTVEGKCGGCCGLCQPKDGIKLDLAPT